MSLLNLVRNHLRRRSIRRRHHNSTAEALEDRTLLAIDIVFDYSLDTSGFFTAERQAAMEAAAAQYEDYFSDSLAAIPAPTGSNTWTAGFTHPSDGSDWSQENLELAENEIRIYLGARNLPGSTIALASYSYSYFGVPSWNNLIEYRGQAQTGYETAPWGGSISFDSTNSWHSGVTTDGLDGSESDLYSVALHEIGHIMGVTTCSVEGCDTAWDLWIDSSGNFSGTRAVEEYGSTVPADESHLAEGVSIDGQEAAMDPTIPDGTRKEMTRLDYAILEDIGWEVRYGNDLTGTSGNDTYSYDPANRTATLNGDDYVVTQPGDVRFDGSGGTDTVTLLTTDGNDVGSMIPDSVINYGDGYKFTAVRSESISLEDSGGDDTVVMRGTTGDDSFVAQPGSATLTAPSGSEISVIGFETIITHDSAGNDTGTLTDSNADETFIGKPTYAYLASASSYIYLGGYNTVTATASVGGRDLVGLYDSVNDDTLIASPTSVTLSGPGFSITANLFDGVNTYSTVGGMDIAELSDSAGDDLYVAKPEFAYLYGTDFYNYVQGFNRVIATASTGNDEAQYYDRNGDDRMIAKPTYSYMFNTPAGYLNYSTGFDTVRIWSTKGGYDRLDLYSNLDYVFQYSGNWDVFNV